MAHHPHLTSDREIRVFVSSTCRDIQEDRDWLAEIESSRPFFIGLLGEGYGWVPKPEEIPGELLEREAWLKDHLQRSVTELEIIHGVLRAFPAWQTLHPRPLDEK